MPKVVQELKWEVWRRTSNYLEQVLRKEFWKRWLFELNLVRLKPKLNTWRWPWPSKLTSYVLGLLDKDFSGGQASPQVFCQFLMLSSSLRTKQHPLKMQEYFRLQCLYQEGPPSSPPLLSSLGLVLLVLVSRSELDPK